ncbi:Kinesin-like protein kif19, partial [Thoreauomyces humboldtii]
MKSHVSVRIRPLAAKELGKDNIQTTARAVDDYSVCITEPTPDSSDDHLRKDRSKGRIYAFDQVFGETATQEEVFERTVGGLIESVVAGFNATVFAYGATGAGKTYTMLGTDTSPGIISLTLSALFATLEPTPTTTFTVTLTYLEIYNENIRDLLSGKADYLDLREDAGRGVVVAGITAVCARSPAEVLGFLRKGNRYRTQEATGANEVSSRSHAVLQVLVGCTTKGASGRRTERFGKLSMIDLAGSERAAETKNRGMRMIEGANINRSLLALGNCITALAEPSKRGKYVNYRDSKLTRLLKDSLGGNCRTAMIANISPASSNFDETLNTLKYAMRARTIKTKVTQQITTRFDPYNSTIQDLRSEIGALKDRLVRAESTTILPLPPIPIPPIGTSTSTHTLSSPFLLPGTSTQTGDHPPRPGTKDSVLTSAQRRSVTSAGSGVEEQSMFTDVKAMLEKLFKDHRTVRRKVVEMGDGDTGRMEEIDEEIRSIRASIPRSLDRRSRAYLDLMIQTHFTYIENQDLHHLHALQTALQTLTSTTLTQATRRTDLLTHLAVLQRPYIPPDPPPAIQDLVDRIADLVTDGGSSTEPDVGELEDR